MRRELARLVRRMYRGQPRPDDWQGVFPTAAAVGESGDGFAGEPWLAMTRDLTRHAMDLQSPFVVRSEIQMLATTIAVAGRTPTRVLDFGGGMGIGYFGLARAMPEMGEMVYDIVEGERVCTEAEKLLGTRRGLRLLRAMPERTARYDVVYACSSLQYVDDVAGLLATFAAYEPRFILLADVPAGDIRTFWTAQLTVPNSRIAYKFMNLDELVGILRGLGYALRVRGTGERPLLVESLPVGSRVNRTLHLLFSR